MREALAPSFLSTVQFSKKRRRPKLALTQPLIFLFSRIFGALKWDTSGTGADNGTVGKRVWDSRSEYSRTRDQEMAGKRHMGRVQWYRDREGFWMVLVRFEIA